MTDLAGAQASIAEPYATQTVRPPLTARAKRGAVIAGVVGFLFLGIGFAMASFAVSFALIGALSALILWAASGSNSRSGAGFGQLISRFDIAPWIAPLVAIVILGIVLMVAAILMSGRVLAAHQVRRPWAVTWAGAGIATVASGILTGMVNTGVTWLSWWWMAHAMRPAAAIDSFSQSVQVGPRA